MALCAQDENIFAIDYCFQSENERKPSKFQVEGSYP